CLGKANLDKVLERHVADADQPPLENKIAASVLAQLFQSIPFACIEYVRHGSSQYSIAPRLLQLFIEPLFSVRFRSSKRSKVELMGIVVLMQPDFEIRKTWLLA